MKKVTIFLVVWFFFAANAWAAPYLVCNPDTSANPPTYYKVKIDSAAVVQSPAETVTGGVRLHHDIGALNLMQTHQFTVDACKVNDVGVEVCSTPPVGFTYPAPVAPTAPSGVKLEK